MKKNALAVGVYNPKNIYQASPLPSDTVFAKGLRKNGYNVYEIDYRGISEPNNALLKASKQILPDLFWFGKAEKIEIETVKKLRKEFPKSKFVKYACDVREIPQNHDLKLLNYMDLFVGTFGGSYLKKHKEFMPDKSKVVSMVTFTDSEFFKSLDSSKQWKSDLLWTGRKGWGDNPMRNKVIDFLQKNNEKYDIKLFGLDSNWLQYPEYVQAICGTKIGIGANSFNRIKYSSDRLGNYMSCGTFYLAHYFEGIEEIFQKGFHLDYFSSIEELEEKIDYYLKNDNIRRKIAKQGRDFVLKHFDSKPLVNNLLNVLEKGVSKYKFDEVY